MTETSVGKLFIAGILPGILGVLLYMSAVTAHTLIDPKAGPAAPRTPWRQRIFVLRAVWPTVALFTLVIGGIYLGVFTAEEAAGIGAFGALMIALSRRLLTVQSLTKILAETARATASLMAVLIGALIFANFIGTTGIAGDTVAWIRQLEVPAFVVLLMIVVLYLLLGCILESLSMILLTIPVLFPLLVSLGYDPVWFGILIVVLVEVSMISPPIGMNLFVIQAMSGVSTMTMYRGIWPFILADVVRVTIIAFIPAFVLFLPNQMG
jgi:tripartite ATP-independent transporter DctM subunit